MNRYPPEETRIVRDTSPSKPWPPGPPWPRVQAVVLVAVQSAAVAFIQQFRADPRPDPNCSMILMSVGSTPDRSLPATSLRRWGF